METDPKSGTGPYLDSLRKSPLHSYEDLRASTDPLILNIKGPSGSQAEANGVEKRDPNKDSASTILQDLTPKKQSRSYSQTYDGVFSNLTAKPEIMVLPKGNPEEADPPPAYSGPRTAGHPRFFTGSTTSLPSCIDDVYLDEMEVGNVIGYILMSLFVLLFQAYGFMIGFILAQSHATRFGCYGGLGLLLAFSAPSLERALAELVEPTIKDYMPIIGLCVGMSGYLIFIYSIVAFQRIRRMAELMIAPHHQGAIYNAEISV